MLGGYLLNSLEVSAGVVCFVSILHYEVLHREVRGLVCWCCYVRDTQVRFLCLSLRVGSRSWLSYFGWYSLCRFHYYVLWLLLFDDGLWLSRDHWRLWLHYDVWFWFLNLGALARHRVDRIIEVQTIKTLVVNC